jgi:hypothetical protein
MSASPTLGGVWKGITSGLPEVATGRRRSNTREVRQ